MALRIRLGHSLALIAIVAVFLSLIAPDFRENGVPWLGTIVVAAITALFAVSFVPVWTLLFYLRRRSRRGLRTQVLDYFYVLVAILSSLGLLFAITYGITAIPIK